MTRCLRCKKPCETITLFCDDCLSFLKDQPEQALEAEITLEIEKIPASRANVAEQALLRLTDAARYIEKLGKGRRRPRTSRLSPLYDVSADIQRQNTPMYRSKDDDSSQGIDLSKSLPDLWPWLGDTDINDSETDAWLSSTDPLLLRSFDDTLHMRQADIQKVDVIPRKNKGRRTFFLCLVVIVAIALIADSFMVSYSLMRPWRNVPVVKGPPVLTISSSSINYGQMVTLYIQHFSPLTRVYLTHDAGEHLKTTVGNSPIQVDDNGSAHAAVPIDGSWSPGLHTIVAEDTKTRYTASTTLQVESNDSRPPLLQVSMTQMDFGAGLQGANTIKLLTLSNAGSGTIIWSASSDQSWLLLTPNQGMFTGSQAVAIGVQRNNLSPGQYTGKITFSSSGTGLVHVQIRMQVQPLPVNPGAVLSATPAALAFTTVDGMSDPSAQYLVVSNPGSTPLHWAVGDSRQNTDPNQAELLKTFGHNTDWLVPDHTSGVVQPGSTSIVNVSAHSQGLLPGVYMSALVFSSKTALNDLNDVVISLTVQPRCGVALNSGSMSFTAVSGRGNPNNQALTLTRTASCLGSVNWHATAVASWLTITPASGQLQGVTGTVMTVGINNTGLRPGEYITVVSIVTAQMTQSVMVQLTVQESLSPIAPIISASPLNLNFSTTAGEADPPGQAVTITNPGRSNLTWHASVDNQTASWLHISTKDGVIKAGQTTQLIVNVSTANLTSGAYEGQISLGGTDSNGVVAGGSPQLITVNFMLLTPCTLSLLASVPSFSATRGADPKAYRVMVSAIGNCTWPLNWEAHVVGTVSWLQLSSASGSLAGDSQSDTFMVVPISAGLPPGNYQAQISISAEDATGMQAQGSPQTLPVTLAITGSTSTIPVNATPATGG